MRMIWNKGHRIRASDKQTHTAVMQDTAAVLFRVKTLQRLTEVPHTHLVGLQRMLLRQDLQRSAKFSLHMQSALHTLFQ